MAHPAPKTPKTTVKTTVHDQVYFGKAQIFCGRLQRSSDDQQTGVPMIIFRLGEVLAVAPGVSVYRCLAAGIPLGMKPRRPGLLPMDFFFPDVFTA